MKIERIDEKTVKCFLSNEDLQEYEIDYKDFITRSPKAKEIVQEIMEQAQVEVGYKPPKFAFDLQIMMVPEQGLVLTFSEHDPEIKDGEALMDCLREMKRLLLEGKEKAEARSGQSQPDTQAPPPKPEFAVFVFAGLRDVMDYAASLPKNLRVDSQLYVMNGLYYLVLEKGHASYERYSRACIQALEFSSLYAADDTQLLPIKEHGECLIAEKAIKKLS